MTRRAWILIVTGYVILALGFIVATLMIQNDRDRIDRTQEAIATVQVKGLKRLQRGQVFDCQDRLIIRRMLDLPKPVQGGTGDCEAIASAYEELIAEAESLERTKDD